MLTRQISVATPIFLLIFLIQEAVISQFRLPGGGFSILLIFALTWAVLSQPEVAAVIGFSAGVLMDLSQSASGPFGPMDFDYVACRICNLIHRIR
jgi:hypothetical protein